ncbi:hypothetical protein KR026_002069, partial [Drosophila bipectinata]
VGSGWIVVYGVLSEANYFNRTYEEYERGFGDFGKRWSYDYFIGLEKLHLLTNGNSYELRSKNEKKGAEEFEKCDNFVVGSREEGYMVKDIEGCSGDIQLSIRLAKFSTWDRDQDGD